MLFNKSKKSRQLYINQKISIIIIIIIIIMTDDSVLLTGHVSMKDNRVEKLKIG